MFTQLQSLLSDSRYENYDSASSSTNTFNGTLNIPKKVDLAIGDNQTSNSSNWMTRRSLFLSMNYQQTSFDFKSDVFLSQWSVAAIHEIAECGQKNGECQAIWRFYRAGPDKP